MPAPSSVDWDGDGEANSKDEWIEVHNPSLSDLDLTGWMLDDRAGGGSKPYSLRPGTRLRAGGYAVFYQRDTGIALNNTDGDEVRLLTPDGIEVDVVHYEETAPDRSYSRTQGCSGAWLMILPPSPGRASPVPLWLPLVQRPSS
jgi:hypothetical protein